ncbi:endonuclease V isoform X2 [Python bivittatus]|uniref:Endonuclease V isoform X2 n=1 Tax=Python bivittatus TaxID=176946 RepID=A0A9F5MYW6_PYTBI|nr:endonuclease V isoform X2 [Python bivittatus]
MLFLDLFRSALNTGSLKPGLPGLGYDKPRTDDRQARSLLPFSFCSPDLAALAKRACGALGPWTLSVKGARRVRSGSCRYGLPSEQTRAFLNCERARSLVPPPLGANGKPQAWPERWAPRSFSGTVALALREEPPEPQEVGNSEADTMADEMEEGETSRRWERQQIQMKEDVIEQDTEEWQSNFSFTGLERVGGMDLSYLKGDATRACASLVVLSYPDLEVLYEDCCVVAVNAPYVAGFLAFREVTFLLEAVQRLEVQEPGLRPQVLLVDGNGILHHRGFGIACHLGVLTGLPCIGVAKNLLQVEGLANDELHKKQIQDLQAGGDAFPLSSTSGKLLGMADIRSREYIRKHLEVNFALPLPQPERDQGLESASLGKAEKDESKH